MLRLRVCLIRLTTKCAKKNCMNTAEAKRVLETALLCAHEPLTVNMMKKLFQDSDDDVDVVGADTI